MSRKMASPTYGSINNSINQAVADDGLRFAGMKKSITNGMNQPTRAMRVVIVAQFQIIQPPPLFGVHLVDT
jgi:hypothetical protein